MQQVEDRRDQDTPPRSGSGGIVTLASLLVFLGVGGLAGGSTFIADPSGETMGLDTGMLDGVPLVSDYLVPGWFILVVLGLLPLLTVPFLLRPDFLRAFEGIEQRLGWRLGWLAALLEGVALTVWIGLELIYLDEVATVQVVFGALGILIAVVALLPVVRNRYRV